MSCLALGDPVDLDGLLKSVFTAATFTASSAEFKVNGTRDQHFSKCSLDPLSQKRFHSKLELQNVLDKTRNQPPASDSWAPVT